MSNQAAALSKNYNNGTPIEVDFDNDISTARKRKYHELVNFGSGDIDEGLENALQHIENNRGDIEKYVVSRGEIPIKDAEKLALQAYNLRCDEIEAISMAMNLPNIEANYFLEQQESEDLNSMGNDFGNYLKDNAATVGYIAQCLNGDADNFIDGGLVSGIINTVGTKINSATLLRAAKGKKAGILGFLSTGGTKTYNALVDYLAKNPTIKTKVLNGQITDVDQTGFFGTVNNTNDTGGIKGVAKDVIDEVRKAETKKAIKKALPFIIIGVIVIILVTVYIAKRKK